MNFGNIIVSVVVAAVVGFFAGQYASNQDMMSSGDSGMHKVVIQVSTDDARTQKIALNNAANVQQAYGDQAMVEVVAYGPGLSILTAEGENAGRVSSMAESGVTFSACNNTMTKIEKKKGHKPMLSDGVTVVPAGVGRIMELQESGYSYIRP